MPRDGLVRGQRPGIPQNVVERASRELGARIVDSCAHGVGEPFDRGDATRSDLDLLRAADRDVVDGLDARQQFGVELQHAFDPPLKSNSKLQVQLLSPLAELCSIPYPDVRQKQLDTVLHILHSSGESLNHGWPLVLTIIGDTDKQHSDILIRSAFQCLQLVFADFLPTIPYRCYPQCVEAATKFGSQETELNVSLTAVGLLWNLSDYFFQNGKALKTRSEEGDNKIFPDFPGCKNIPSFDKLWMCLFYKLKDLCLGSRPAVRKSSGQTLFSTIAAHGSVLK